MSLTANFDFCIEMSMAKVKEIFHLAFKTEERYPHNIGPITENLSGRTVTINVRIHDDEDRTADLSFRDSKHILFSFPFDISAEVPDAPDPALTRITMHVRANVPALLNSWDETVEGVPSRVLGLDFGGITANDVEVVELEGLPVIDVNNFIRAIHSRYDTVQHVYTEGGSRLVLYDGNRDTTLTPPNGATPSEIQAALETHGADRFLKITAPIYVSVPLPAPLTGTYTSFGRIVFWRRVIQTDTTITVEMNAEPADPALATQVQLDTAVTPDYEIAQVRAAIHTRYDTLAHTITLSGNTLRLYDDARDASLSPALPVSFNPYHIDAVFETHSAVEYLKVRIPVHVTVNNVPIIGTYTSFGRIIFWRAVTRTADQVSINFTTEPAPAALKNTVELDTVLPLVTDATASAIKAGINPALAGFGTVNAPTFNVLLTALKARARTAIGAFGVITEPALSEAAARDLIKRRIAEYLEVRRYPVYSPKSPDPDEPLRDPVGFLLIPDNVLSILLNRRTGTAADDHAPDNFLGANDLAVAVGRAKVDEIINTAINEQFPNLHNGGELIERDGNSATLHELSVTPSDPGAHDESEGHLWVEGEAEVHIDCWPDPDVSFDGPIFIDATRTETDGQCGLELTPRLGDFDVGQSCLDCLIAFLIPFGFIVFIIVEITIDEVGGSIAEEIAEGQGRAIRPIPPVVNGIAKVTACLTDFLIRSSGFIMPGEVTVRRYSRSFEDLREAGKLPRPGQP
ncbi:MAG: hypothetical protein IT323_15425 [Anaerolineae bacterium]|nr:hypothetical protein [Anaerolineae bacterium]